MYQKKNSCSRNGGGGTPAVSAPYGSSPAENVNNRKNNFIMN